MWLHCHNLSILSLPRALHSTVHSASEWFLVSCISSDFDVFFGQNESVELPHHDCLQRRRCAFSGIPLCRAVMVHLSSHVRLLLECMLFLFVAKWLPYFGRASYSESKGEVQRRHAGLSSVSPRVILGMWSDCKTLSHHIRSGVELI